MRSAITRRRTTSCIFAWSYLQISRGCHVAGTQPGRNVPLTGRVLNEMLKSQPKQADGTYRAMASRYIAGQLAGPFRYQGMRTDDPNDTVSHEDRRELRGLGVFAAWLDHHDTKAVNSMDSLVNEQGLRYLKHYLLDFGDILGSDRGPPEIRLVRP